MKKFLKIVAIIAIILLLCYSIVNAETLDELKTQREEIQNQINEANINLEEINIELTNTLEEITKLDEKIYGYEETIEEITSNLDELQQEINESEEKLTIIEEDYKIQKDILEKRLVTLYEEGDTQYLDVLLNSKSIVDFISNYYLIGEIAEYDTELLDNIEKEKIQIEKLQTILNEKQTKLKESKETKEKSLVALENAKVVRNSYLKGLSEEEIKIKEEIDTYEEELDKLDLQILYLTVGTTDSKYVGGIFAWPLPGYTTITSDFGGRIHPILKTYRVHSGIDIGAPTGTKIIAANSGVVTTASYLSSYGNAVIIDHGGGISTIYAHGSKILVEVGDVVESGDIIMEVGSTGLSTGPHLHFGISVNGTYVDPYPYITTDADIEE